MSTRSSLLWHWDDERRVGIHIYEEVFDDPPHHVHLEVKTEYATITVPWPPGFSTEELQKLAIDPSQTRGIWSADIDSPPSADE